MAGETSSATPFAQPLSGRLQEDARDLVAAASPWRRTGPLIRVRVPVKNVVVEVRHLMLEIPEGFADTNSDCLVKRAPGVLWTKELAYLVSDSDNSTIEGHFGMYRETVRNVDAS